jgi:hypothetical protein
VPVGESSQSRHLADQPVCLLFTRLLVEDSLGIRIERRQRAHGAYKNSHRMSIMVKIIYEPFDVLVDYRVIGHVVREVS